MDLASALGPIRRGPGYDLRPTEIILSVASNPRQRHYRVPMGRTSAPRIPSPPALDLLLAAALTVSAVVELSLDPAFHASPVELAAAAAPLLALSWRRVAPLAVLATIVAGSLAQTVVFPDAGSALGFTGYLIAVFSAARHCSPQRGVLALALALAGVVAEALSDLGISEVIISSVVVVGSWLAGYALRTRQLVIVALEDKASELERHRAAEARTAAEAERARITRELHDIVAHSVGVMVVQAGAAEQVMDREPERARRALGSIQRVGNEAIGELRRLLGVLRTDAAETGLAPQPGIAELEGLVEQARETGLAVELSTEGAPRPLPAGIDLCAFRVVQEALTNAIKHAGRTRCRVRVSYGQDKLEILVADDGSGDLVNGDSGHGLVGMRERVALYGGQVTAGPLEDGGFGIHARLPIQAAKP